MCGSTVRPRPRQQVVQALFRRQHDRCRQYPARDLAQQYRAQRMRTNTTAKQPVLCALEIHVNVSRVCPLRILFSDSSVLWTSGNALAVLCLDITRGSPRSRPAPGSSIPAAAERPALRRAQHPEQTAPEKSMWVEIRQSIAGTET